MLTFEPIDTIYSKVTPPQEIRKHFKYMKEFWRKSQYHKEKHNYPVYLIDKKGVFLSGLLPRLIKWCDENGLEYKTYSPKSLIAPHVKIEEVPKLHGITFREDQLRLMQSAKEEIHGVLISPTGSGKTVIAAGIISMFPKAKVLFLCHTISLIKQTIKEFNTFKIGKISQVGSGSKDISGRIVVSTMQSFSKIPIEDICDKFDVVIVDECHHVSGFSGTYAKILTSLITPIKFGITATPPISEESKLALEALIGPIIEEVTIEEAMNLDILAKPKVKLIRVPLHLQARAVANYPEIYTNCIVNYRLRNRLIIEEVKRLNKENKSCIVYVNQIEHGEKLLDIAERMEVPCFFVKGSVDGEDREKLRNDLHNKKIMCVIATTVWTEGINIRSLDCIIIAGGGRNEKILLQKIGRGLRIYIGKDEILIIDFVDSGKYLAEHCCERLGIYIDNGWL